MEERRRVARTGLHGLSAMWPGTVDVQVLDISLGGVLLHTNQAINVGTRGCLHLNLWGAAFAADIEVRRVSPGAAPGHDAGFDVGTSFVEISQEHRHLLERFTRP